MCGDLLDENGNRNAILPPHISPDAKVGAKRADGGDEVRLPDLRPAQRSSDMSDQQPKQQAYITDVINRDPLSYVTKALEWDTIGLPKYPSIRLVFCKKTSNDSK